MFLTSKSSWVAFGFISWLLTANLPNPIAQAHTSPSAQPEAIAKSAILPTGQPLTALAQRLTQLHTAHYAGLEVGMTIVDLETGNYLSLNGDRLYATASIIKLPILIALFQEVDAGRVRLDESLTMTRDMVAGGSGNMQYQQVDSQFSVLETATRMITISDNTATNMIVRRLGGIQALNDRLQRWGLQHTRMQNLLPDRFGTNVTTANELAKLLAMLDRRQLLSASSQAQVLNIMSRVQNRTLLPAGLGQGAAIAHKTGDIGAVQGDAGIIRLPSGKRYLAAILVKRDRNDPNSRDFIQAASRLVYNYLSQPPTTARVN